VVKVFKLMFYTETMTHIGAGRVKRNIYYSKQYLPVSTVRGALATALFENCKRGKNRCEGINCPEHEDCIFYLAFQESTPYTNVYVLPGFPLCQECGEVSVVAPIYIQQCKVCGTLTCYYDMIVDALKSGHNIFRTQWTCPNGCGLVTLKPVGDFICPNCSKTMSVPLRRITVTAINRNKWVAEEGMLYSFEGIREGTSFGSYLFTTDDKAGEAIEGLNGDYIRIGGGKSRGYGEVRVSVKSLSLKQYLNQRVKKIIGSIKDNYLIATVVTPLFNLKIDNGIIKTYFDTNVNMFKETAEKAHQILTGQKKDFKINIGKIYVFGDTIRISGWSLKYDRRKPTMIAISPGSILCLKFSDSISVNDAEILVALEIIGYGSFSKIGYGKLYFSKIEAKSKEEG